jgi:hypothetical protein
MKRLMILSLLVLLALSTLARAEVTTDKAIYMPGETINIVLDYSELLTDVKLNIINPSGNTEISGTPMSNTSSTSWSYNYTLNTRALNGTYTIDINALQGGTVVDASMPVLTFNGNFDVFAWNVDTYLNKYHFIPGETVSITMLITDKYSGSLTFNVFYNITNPLGNEVENKSLTLTEVNDGFTDTYDTPADYPFGNSNINIALTDSDGRNSNTSLSFSVSKAFTIVPNNINETLNETIEKTFEFENFMDYDINVINIEVSDSLKDAVLIVQRPYLIPANDKSIMRVRLVATNQTESSYSGEIDVSTDLETIPIYVNLKIMPSANTQGNNQNHLENMDYSYIIWYFAAGIVAVIIILTVLRYRKIIKRKKEEKKRQEDKKKREDNYYKSREEYRTEYY